MDRFPTALLAIALSCGCGAEGEDPDPPPSSFDSGVADTRPRPDTQVSDVREDSAALPDGTVSDGATDTTTSTKPPPIEDTSFVEDYGTPAPGTHVEGLIGADGGELAGTAGSPLAGVKLVVPKGALPTNILFALDLGAATAPSGTPLASPYVRVGPDGVAFAIPAKLTLPWTSSVTNVQLVPLARIGFTWTSLHDPVGDATTITALMRRTSGAGVAVVDYSSVAATIASVAPTPAAAGEAVFIDGTSFGMAQVFRPDGFVSTVKYGGIVAETLAWSDTNIAIRVPSGASGSTVTVTTPAGSMSK